MTVDRLTDLMKNKEKIISIALLGIAAICGVVALAKVAGYFMASARAENVVTQAIARGKSDPKAMEAQVAKARPIAEDLKRSNLFSPPPPKQHPVENVLAIFGDEVWIKDKWYKAGDSVGDAKIVAIGPTSVTVEWDGNKKDFFPIQAKVADASRPQRGGPSPGDKGGEKEGPPGSPGQINVQIQGGPRPGGMGMRGDFMMMRGRIGEMSPDERERFFREMRERRERMGGGRGRPGGDRGRGGRR